MAATVFHHWGTTGAGLATVQNLPAVVPSAASPREPPRRWHLAETRDTASLPVQRCPPTTDVQLAARHPTFSAPVASSSVPVAVSLVKNYYRH